MKYGYFDDSNKEYVITSPDTPLPWINYLGTNSFFTLLSNTCGGYSFYKDARLRRLTRYRYNNNPLDVDGFRVYIHDENQIWNPGFMPMCTQLDQYECRHGLGYSSVSGSKGGLLARQEFLVPKNDNCLLMKLTLENNSKKAKEIDLYTYIEFCLWDAVDDSSNFQRNYSCGEIEVEPAAIYHKTEYRERRNHYAVNWASLPFESFETDRTAFCGIHHGTESPDAVKCGRLKGSIAHGWSPVSAMHYHISLAPGETKDMLFGLGYIENPPEEKWEADNVINKEKAHQLISLYNDPKAFDTCLESLKEYWNSLLSGFQLSAHTNDSETDEKLNRMVNIWNQYQCMVTFNMSRSASYFESGLGRGMGFRDSCQDILGFVHMIPERARERILDIAATQFPDGSAYHQYQPLTKKGNLAVGSGFNDDPLWLIACTGSYIAETGDYGILSEQVDFDNDPSLAQPLMEHLRRSINYTIDHKGPNGLPLIGRADWNDCLNLNCFSSEPGESFQTTGPSEGPVAESVFIAGMFVKYGKLYAEICKGLAGFINNSEKENTVSSFYTAEALEKEADKILSEVHKMENTILDKGWDGEWFLRAYDAFGKPVGSKICEEGKIFIEPQGMCVMAEVGVETGEAAKALESVEKHLDTKYGIVLHQPAYTKYRLNLGEISSYPPGYKENAGIFCHNNPWVVCAETVLGHGDRAFEIYKKTCPAFIENISEIHKTEPYVYSQMVAGKDAPTFGEAKNSWLTGTSAWTFSAISQFILGIRPSIKGLIIDPVIPSEWDGFDITRKYRGCNLDICVKNSGHAQCGIKEAFIDGKPADLYGERYLVISDDILNNQNHRIDIVL